MSGIRIIENPDGTYSYLDLEAIDLPIIPEAEALPRLTPRQANKIAVLDKARAALAANAAEITTADQIIAAADARVAATNLAEANAQLAQLFQAAKQQAQTDKIILRELNALLRLRLRELDDVSDT